MRLATYNRTSIPAWRRHCFTQSLTSVMMNAGRCCSAGSHPHDQLPSRHRRYNSCMCRNIQQLRGAEPPATDQEIHDAALQFIRKVSGYRKPSKANEAAFDAAVDEVADAVNRLLARLVVAPGSRPAELRQRMRQA